MAIDDEQMKDWGEILSLPNSHGVLFIDQHIYPFWEVMGIYCYTI